MATINYPYMDPGRAAFEELDTYVQNYLLAGQHPELAPAYSFPLANDTSFEQFSVVGLDGDGNLALAETGNSDPADDIQAIGVLAHEVSLGSSGSATGPVWYQGNFNMDFLVWDDSFDTDAKKEAAFRGAPTPTNIIIAKRD